MTHADAQLNYWGNCFIATNLADVMTFEEFMTLSPTLRERRVAQMDVVRHVQHRLDRPLPDASLHGDRLIDPMRHGLRRYRNNWFVNQHRHV